MSKAKIQRGARRKRTAPRKALMIAYRVLIGYDVPCYGELEFEAKSNASARRKARRMLQDWDEHLKDVQSEPEWEGADTHRVVHVTNTATEEVILEHVLLFAPRAPKVLIQVHGGIAEYVIDGGPVDVVLVDEDNIDAGDPPVELDESWRALTKDVFFQDGSSKYVRFVK